MKKLKSLTRKMNGNKSEKSKSKFDIIIETIESENKKLSKSVDKLIEEQNKLVNNCIKIYEKMKTQEKIFKNMSETSEYARETLENVLVAIRQNENLQAWYPPQQGYPEMKVVGRHPLTEKRDHKKKGSK